MKNKWELWCSICLFCLGLGIWFLTMDSTTVPAFVFLLAGMMFFLVTLACYIGQNPKSEEEAVQFAGNVSKEELANCIIDIITLLSYAPENKLDLKDVQALIQKKGHKLVSSMGAVKFLLLHNHCALRNGKLYYFQHTEECIFFKKQTKADGLRSSI